MEFYVLSGSESIIISVLNYSLLSMGNKHFLLYQNLAFKQCVCSVPESPYPSSCAKFLQTILD